MSPKASDVWQGTLALMVLQTLDTMGPLHGYGIARRIEQTSGDRLSVNYGTLYPALLKLEQEGFVASEWGVSDNNRRAKFYRLTRAGRKQLDKEARRMAADHGHPRAVPARRRRPIVTRAARSSSHGSPESSTAAARDQELADEFERTWRCKSRTTSAPG